MLSSELQVSGVVVVGAEFCPVLPASWVSSVYLSYSLEAQRVSKYREQNSLPPLDPFLKIASLPVSL